MIAAIKNQIKEFKLEVFDRVDWPSSEKVRTATVAVVVVSVFVGLYLAACDYGMGKLLSLFFNKH